MEARLWPQTLLLNFCSGLNFLRTVYSWGREWAPWLPEWQICYWLSVGLILYIFPLELTKLMGELIQNLNSTFAKLLEDKPANRLGENFVGSIDLQKVLIGNLIVSIGLFIGVEIKGQVSIALFDFFFGGIGRELEDLVGVIFHNYFYR